MTTLAERLDGDRRRRRRGPERRRVLRLRRHADRRLLGDRVLPPPHPPRRDRAARARADAARGRRAGSTRTRTSSASSTLALRAWEGRTEDGARGARRAALQARHRRAACDRRPGSWRAPIAIGATGRARLVGDALPGGADGPRARRRRTCCAPRSRPSTACSPAAPPGGRSGVRRRRTRSRALAAEHDIDLGTASPIPTATRTSRSSRRSATRVCVEPADRAARRGRAARLAGAALRVTRRAPGSLDVARTAGFYGAMAGAFWTGLGLGLLNALARDDRRRHGDRRVGRRARAGRGQRQRDTAPSTSGRRARACSSSTTRASSTRSC